MSERSRWLPWSGSSFVLPPTYQALSLAAVVRSAS